MARILSKSFRRSFFSPAKAPSSAFNARYCSSKPQFLEIDLASCSSSADGDELISMMENIVHRVNLRNSTPDWLPFLPGSSFWVPPVKPSLGVSDLDHRLVDPLTEDELLAVLNRGWPSPFSFISDEAYEEGISEMMVMLGRRDVMLQMQKEEDEEEDGDEDE